MGSDSVCWSLSFSEEKKASSRCLYLTTSGRIPRRNVASHTRNSHGRNCSSIHSPGVKLETWHRETKAGTEPRAVCVCVSK